MAAIDQYLRQILEATYGEEVRHSIHDAILQNYMDVSESVAQANAAADTAEQALADASTVVDKANSAAQTAEAAVQDANTAVTNANSAVEAANTAITNANEAASGANTAKEEANAAAANANDKAQLADEKATLADTKAQLADTAAANANTAAQNATEKATLADTKAQLADTAAQNATEKANLADAAAGLADTAATNANEKADLAATAATNANEKATLADTAAQNADTKAGLADTAATNANEKATLAETAATIADEKATLANDAATIADEKATLADTAATNANTARDEANTAATNANEKATLANTAATNADNKATLAETAATNADTAAQNANEKATLAETAATNADEKATLADAKAQLADTAATNADTKAGLANDAADRANEISDAIEPIVSTDTETVTGNPVTVETQSAQIAEKTVIKLEPVQDLHGYDHPWPAGGGKNLLQMTVDIVKAKNTSGVWSGNTYSFNGVSYILQIDSGNNIIGITVNGTAVGNYSSLIIPYSLQDGTYILTGVPTTGSAANTYYLDWRNNYGTQTYITSATPYSTITFESPVNSQSVIIVTVGATANNATFHPMIRLASESDATFEPYSNICPITGWTGAKVTRTGKNLLKNNQLTSKTKNGVEIALNSDGSITFNGTCTGWFFQKIYLRSNDEILLPPGNYIISGGIPNVYIKIYLSDGSKVVDTKQILSDVPLTISDENPVAEIRFEINVNSTFNNTTMYLMIRPTSVSNSDYEPYSGVTVPITFPTEAGTVYGGTLTIEKDGSGTLVVDNANIASYSGEILSGAWISDRDVYSAGATPTTGAQVVYELTTPLIYSLSAEQVKLLKGSNAVSTDGTSLELTIRKGQFVTLEEYGDTGVAFARLLSTLADEIEEENEHLEDILNSMYILSPEGSEL